MPPTAALSTAILQSPLAIDRNALNWRHEAKFWVPELLLPALRCAIARFCHPDPWQPEAGIGYPVHSLQFDSQNLAFHEATRSVHRQRYQLRARSFDPLGGGPVTLEIKSRQEACWHKQRCLIQAHGLDHRLPMHGGDGLGLVDEAQRALFHDFCRRLRQSAARPVTWMRYQREAWNARNGEAVRFTLDSELCYQPCRTWSDWGQAGRWRRMDPLTGSASCKECTLLEIKSATTLPAWAITLTRRFNLRRRPISKYLMAVATEYGT